MIHHHSEDQGRHWAIPRQLRREETTVDIGSRIYGGDEGNDGLFDDDHPTLDDVEAELRRRGAKDQDGVDLLLPAYESQFGQLTERERAAVLRRFDR